MKEYKFCQSCGMPLKRDPQHGATEKNGAKSKKYCSYCYSDGSFTSPDIDTPEKMQQFCIKTMKEQGVPRPVAWLFTRGIPRLERWKHV
ncbi:MAG: zinc ribbon domain-containing protein [Spirochaetes bacterium]|jgi:hypothetical protein|nr:zinc ribbon domain-containing protein [Spirochaetota bacterium]